MPFRLSPHRRLDPERTKREEGPPRALRGGECGPEDAGAVGAWVGDAAEGSGRTCTQGEGTG